MKLAHITNYEEAAYDFQEFQWNIEAITTTSQQETFDQCRATRRKREISLSNMQKEELCC